MRAENNSVTVAAVDMITVEPMVGKELYAEDLLGGQYGRSYGDFRWYKVVRRMCSVHSDEPATLECKYCENHWSSKHMHCCRQCFIESWNQLELHKQTLGLHTAEEVDEHITSVDNREMVSSWGRYTPTEEDIGSVLLLECAGEKILYTRPVIPLRPRRMMKVNSHCGGRAASFTCQSFTIVTYNVLAQEYATPEKHRLCPPWALQWEHRGEKLLTEIVKYDADIICLQEVQRNHYSEFFHPELARHGYAGEYQEKQRSGDQSQTVDGCATFYRLDQFEQLKKECIDLSSYAINLPGRFHKDNIALNVVLSFRKTGHCLCIANTHIHASTNNGDVKLWQVYYLLNKLESFVQENCCDQLVMCGDFNSVPGSAVHSLLTKGHVDSAHRDLAYDPDGVLKPVEKFRHTLPLVSAYACYFRCNTVDRAEIVKKMDVGTREPRFTNFSCDFRGTLDYIFHTAPNLKVLSLLELIDEDESEVKNYALPSPHYPSDHIAIAAKFQYIMKDPRKLLL